MVVYRVHSPSGDTRLRDVTMARAQGRRVHAVDLLRDLPNMLLGIRPGHAIVISVPSLDEGVELHHSIREVTGDEGKAGDMGRGEGSA